MNIKTFLKNNQSDFIIQQSIVREILSNEESFKRYVLNNKKKCKNCDYSEGDLYANYTIEYFYYLRQHGYKFNKMQINIAKRCKDISQSVFMCFDYSDSFDFEYDSDFVERNSKFRKIVIELINDEEKLKAFFYGKIQIKGTNYEELCEYVLSKGSICDYFTKNNIKTENDKQLRNMHLLRMYCERRQYSFDGIKDEKYEIDDKLKAKIFSEVSQDLLNKKNRTNEEQVELAYQLFVALNRNLAYDEIMHIEDQRDLTMKENNYLEIYKTYYKNPAEITLDNNNIACRSWAFLYSRLLNEVNIKAFISHSHVHKRVLFLDNDAGMYIADGTQVQNELMASVEQYAFRLTDMDRSKLGFKTSNFIKISLDKQNRQIQEVYIDGEFKKLKVCLGQLEKKFNGIKARIKRPFSSKEYGIYKDFFIRALKKEPIDESEYEIVLKMLKSFEEAGCVPGIFVYPCGENGLENRKSFAIKVKLINRILLALEPHMANDNTIKRSLLSNFKFWFLGVDSVDFLDRLYILDENNKVKIKPLLFINGGFDNFAENNCIMYIWEDKKGFVRITSEQIIEKIKNGELYYNINSARDNDRDFKSGIECQIESELGSTIYQGAYKYPVREYSYDNDDIDEIYLEPVETMMYDDSDSDRLFIDDNDYDY
ncbi:MAG: hypothetical protein IKE01_05685 [Clostridia bacterium]|nr:hypothetical protein [Clostridia bacterium]